MISLPNTGNTCGPRTRSRAPLPPCGTARSARRAASRIRRRSPWCSSWSILRRKAGAGSMATTSCPSSFKVSGSPTGSKSPPTPRPRNPKPPPPDPSGHHQDSAIAPAPPRHSSLLKTPVSIAPDVLDFRRLIGRGETVGWAEATAEPLFLTRLLDAQAERCSPFRVFFPLTFSDSLAAGHPNVTVTALGGAGAGRRFFAGGADNVVPANISDVPGLVASGRLPIDIVLLQVTGPDDADDTM